MAGEIGSLPRPDRRFWRSVLLPVVVIAAIAFVIWWLEYRPGEEAVSPLTGERYGAVSLPARLVRAGFDVGPEEGKLAPNFLLPTLDGGELRLSRLRGKPVVLNFWATWCSPCRREIPQLVDAYDRFRDQGLAVVGVNLQEDRDTIQDYSDDFGMDFPIPIDHSGDVGREYRLLGLPTTYFIDRDGVVRSVYRGPFLETVRDIRVQGAIQQNELLQRIAEIME
ncbi:MAG: TlpA family protein disulfide reductase [Chloroflexi bacterium]|nr:TlpA family protein disulfide reductase [Chloroflexota bacterium]